MQYTPYNLPLFITAALSVALCIYVWRRRSTPGAPALSALLLGVTIWTLAYALTLLHTDLQYQLGLTSNTWASSPCRPPGSSSPSSTPAAWPAPPDPDHAIDDAEYDLALLGPVVRSREAPVPGLAHYLLDTSPHLARALRARARRWTVTAWTPADGLVNPREPALTALAAHRLGAAAHAVTSLERFGTCPYQYFLHAIIGLRPHRPVTQVEQLDPVTRGILHHAVVASVVHTLRAQDALPLTEADRPMAHQVVADTLSSHASALRERLAPAVPRVWQDAVDALHLDLRALVDRMVDDPIWQPVHADLRIGLTDDRDADVDSTPEPTTVLGYPLKGAVDLVEQTAHGQLRVTDLKTGALPHATGARIAGGRMLQPALYAMMLEPLAGDREVVGGRLLAATRRHAFEEVEVPLDERTVDLTRTALDIIDQHIARGMLPAAPVADACERCDFLAVCGRSERKRAAHKAPLGALTTLRKLP